MIKRRRSQYELHVFHALFLLRYACNESKVHVVGKLTKQIIVGSTIYAITQLLIVQCHRSSVETFKDFKTKVWIRIILNRDGSDGRFLKLALISGVEILESLSIKLRKNF